MPEARLDPSYVMTRDDQAPRGSGSRARTATALPGQKWISAEEGTAIVQRQLETATAGIGPGARLVQHDGAGQRLGRLHAKRDRERVGPRELAKRRVHHRVVATEAQRLAAGRLGVVDEHGTVLQRRARLRDAVGRGVAVDGIERQMGDGCRRGGRASGPPVRCATRGNAGSACVARRVRRASVAAMRRWTAACAASSCAGHNSIDGRRRGVGEVRVQTRLVDVVEERKQREVVALRDRVELVVVAARALERQAEHRGAERVHAIGDVLGAELLFDAAAFVGLPVQAVERRRDALLARRRWAAGRRPVATSGTGRTAGCG